MPPAKRTPGPGPTLARSGRVTKWDANVSLVVPDKRYPATEKIYQCDLSLTVDLLEPIKGRRTATILVTEAPPNSSTDLLQPPPRVGSIASITKTVLMMVSVPQGAMSAIMGLAACNRLASCLVVFPEPYRGRADITAFHFSTSAADDLN